MARQLSSTTGVAVREVLYIELGQSATFYWEKSPQKAREQQRNDEMTNLEVMQEATTSVNI